MGALGVVPASRVAMDTSSLLIAFDPLLTFKAPAPKLIISDEFNVLMHVNFSRVNKMEAMNGGSCVNVRVEPRSTFAFARGLSCITYVLLTHVKLMLE